MSAGLQVGGGMKGMLKDGYKHFSGLEQARRDPSKNQRR